jgi:hypothetical protein
LKKFIFKPVSLQVGEAWVGHPYYDVIDNSTDFEMKMRRLTKVQYEKIEKFSTPMQFLW